MGACTLHLPPPQSTTLREETSKLNALYNLIKAGYAIQNVASQHYMLSAFQSMAIDCVSDKEFLGDSPSSHIRV